MASERSNDRQPQELSLFTGAGGGVLGSQLLGHRIVCGVEWDPYCREVLLRRQEEGILEAFPIWDDIRTFDGRPWRGKVDIVTGGFPCQPFSQAGKNKGKEDERNLWPDTIRVIREVRPRYCFLENVPNLLVHEYTGDILGSLAESGYDIRHDCIPASAVGAPHRRYRLWIVAVSNGLGHLHGEPQEQPAEAREQAQRESEPSREDVADTKHKGPREGRSGSDGKDVHEGHEKHGPKTQELCCMARNAWWDIDPADLPDTVEHDGRNRGPSESFVGRVADGVAYRVDRLKAIGNGQVPEVVRAAWDLLNER